MTGKLCRTTIANGKILMKDHELIGIDEEAENAYLRGCQEALGRTEPQNLLILSLSRKDGPAPPRLLMHTAIKRRRNFHV